MPPTTIAMSEIIITTPIGWSNQGMLCKLLVPKNPHYEMITKPFEWKFTRTDLAELLDRLRHRINTNRWAA